jgi:MinD-like ATPase involved in chromosome partitioning or flagellar assembly
MTDNNSHHPGYDEGSDTVLQTKTRKARVIAVTSGKGGVGKTNVTTNLGIALATRGAKVCIFDADTNLANINIILGITPEYTLEHLLRGEKSIDEVMINGPRDIKVIPAASGIADLTSLDNAQRQKLIETLEELEQRFDYLLIDTAAGAGETVQAFINSAQYTIVVISPEPTSLTDAFSLIKVLKKNNFDKPLYILVNMVLNYENSMEVFNRFDVAVKKYLKTKTHYLGYITLDETVISSVRLQQPVIIHKPDSPASRCFFTLATGLGKHLPEKNEPSSFSAYWKEQADREEIDLPVSSTDSEIKEVFIEEGIDILDACDNILQRWSHNLSDLELVTELQQELRTLKGGARMSKIPAVSDVCRSAILLLGSLIEGQQQVTPNHINLMQNALYALSGMLQSVQDNRPLEPATALISDIDYVRMGLPPEIGATTEEKEKANIQAQEPAAETPSVVGLQESSTSDIVKVLLDRLDNKEISANDSENFIHDVIESYIEQNQKYPIDIRKCLYRSLEMRDFPYTEIRDLVFTLESLYEKRCQIPIRSIDDAVIKLFEDVNGSEEKMEELGKQLQASYRRQFNKNLFDPLVELTHSIADKNYSEDEFNHLMQTIKEAYQARFSKDYKGDAENLLDEIRNMSSKMVTQEENLHEDFIRLSDSIHGTLSLREELLAKLNPAAPQEDTPEEE